MAADALHPDAAHSDAVHPIAVHQDAAHPAARASAAPHASAPDADALHPEEFDVPVAGGRLRVCRWRGDGPVVLAAHGITANALSWAPVAQALKGRAVLVAPDLRGRA